tara:strand:- start:4173 stop:5021 length:849 start_codon:yes stop_codon:yes gene_type:complete
MASSWNKGVEVLEEPVQKESQSVFKDVVNQAFTSLKAGGKVVIDKAEDVWDVMSETEIPDIPSPISSFQNVSQKGFEKSLEAFKVLKSTPVATMLDDIFLPAMGRKITEKNFSPESIQILRQMALDNNLKAGDKMKIDYEDFNKYGAELSARFVSGTNEDTKSIKEKLINLKPADEVKMTLGEAMLEVDSEGNIKVIDQYDFNNWAWYGKGKQANGKYLSLSPEEFEGSEEITFTEALMDTIQNAPSDYQMVRNLAFLFGSRDYKDDEKDTGRKVEINLGKI